MNHNKRQIVLIADFNIDNLAGLLNNDDSEPILSALSAPFDQVNQILLDNNHECWKSKPQFALVWTTLEKVSPAFGRLKNFETVSNDEIAKEVDSFCEQLSGASSRVKAMFVSNWTIPSSERGLGMLDYKKQTGIKRALDLMNVRLADNLDSHKNIFVLNTQRWITPAGKNAYNPKLWYLGKILFSNDVFNGALLDIKAAINGIDGQAKKLIVVDLDDTLWGGIVGDIGWENIRIGGHDPVGEAYKDFQKTLKALTNRGIILGIVSKNEEKTALEALAKHPEMVLRADNFAGWKINWNDKARNLAELVSELNLGLESVVFLDDNPVERARVRDSFPQVLVPEMPEDKLLYPSLLKELRCFDSPSISGEDRQRTEKYRAESQRKSERQKIGSVDDWLKNLETVVTAEKLSKVNLERTAQLLNKTNQMNLTTRRMTADELKKWSEQKNHELWTITVSDKFGDSGLTGILSLEFDGTIANVIDFVLSCRVMGRKVEETMLHLAASRAIENGTKEIRARLIPTERNAPCRKFWESSGFDKKSDANSFKWTFSKNYKLPDSIKLVVNQEK